MDRREVIQLAAGLAAVSVLPMSGVVLAQEGGFKPVKEVRERVEPGKIEVMEFFWYGCGHCFNFEPKIAKWKKSTPQDVVFSQIPVGWQHPRGIFERHQKLFYSLEAMGKLEQLNAQVFDAIHLDKKTLATDEQIFDFAEFVGLDRTEFANTYKSFSVATKVAQAKELTSKFGIDGVPTMVVDGKFMTSATLAGTADDSLRVVDALIRRQRQAG